MADGDAHAQGYEELSSGGERVTSTGSAPRVQLPGRDDAQRLGDVFEFHCEAIDKDDEAFGVGLNFLVLAANGRIGRTTRSSSLRGSSGMLGTPTTAVR